MNMTEWLRTLGLERYEQAFRDNRIGADVLPSLTVEDLKDLGVALVGDRRRLLDAIAALRAEAPGGGSPLPNPPPHAGEGSHYNPPPRALRYSHISARSCVAMRLCF